MKYFLIVSLFFASSCLKIYKKENNVKGVEVVMEKKDLNLFIIKKRLDDLFEKTPEARYKLFINIESLKTRGGITSEAYTTSFQINIKASFKLFDVNLQRVVYSSNISKNSNYVSESSKLVAEKVGEDAVKDALAKKIATEIYEDIQERFFEIK